MSCILGLDTSNYKTSLALIRGDETIADLRQFLKVREGERGLRQSEALFQHVQNLPELFGQLRGSLGSNFDVSIDGVAYSTRPRAVTGSYMPCFTAGASQAASIASALDVPAVGFSHQEGHIEASVASFDKRPEGDFLACHFSGGTCEVLIVRQKEHQPHCADTFCRCDGERAFYDIDIIGGTRDISYGQVLDRAGVMLGLPFPCGQALDEQALSAGSNTNVLTGIKAKDAFVHLSGFDTQLRNRLADAKAGTLKTEELIREAFIRISDSIVKMLRQSAEQTDQTAIYMSGGVSSSRFLKEHVTKQLRRDGIDVFFTSPELSSDNAVGTALLGRRYLWG